MSAAANLLKQSVLTVLWAAGATAASLLMSPHIGSRGPLLVGVLGVAIASQISGAAAGLVITACIIARIEYFAPKSDPYMPMVLLIFAIVGVALSVFGGWRKRLEDDRRRIRYNLETAQNIAQIGSWESDLEGRIWCSEQTCRIFGISPHSALLSELFLNLVHPEDRASVRQTIEDAFQTGTAYNLEHRIIRWSDGEVRYVHHQARRICSGGVRWIGSIQDTTEKRRGEMAQQILGDLLQVCSACRHIHDRETHQWHSIESYFRLHSTTRISHGMCPDCGQKWLAEDEIHDTVARR